MRIADFLSNRQVAFESLSHPPAFSTQKLAKALRIKGAQVAKGVLLRGPEGFLLAVLPTNRQVDTLLLSALLGGPVRLATAEEIARRFRDCEWGVVPAFGRLYGVPTLLDESIHPDAT